MRTWGWHMHAASPIFFFTSMFLCMSCYALQDPVLVFVFLIFFFFVLVILNSLYYEIIETQRGLSALSFLAR